MKQDINSRQVLKLNKLWQPIGTESVKRAIEEMYDWDPIDGNWKRLALDCSYPELEDGSFDFSVNPNPLAVGWDEWIELPIRPYDQFLTTGSGKRIRVPEVVITPDYAEMPEKRVVKNLNVIYELYGRRCAYTNKLLSRKQASKDHVRPLSRGGKDDLSNIVLADIAINNKKGDRLNHEAGLPNPVIRQPRNMKLWETLRPSPDHPTWTFFLYLKE